MIIQITRNHDRVLAKRHLLYFEYSRPSPGTSSYKHKIVFYIGRFEIFVGEFGFK